jgi:hypothetical protein
MTKQINPAKMIFVFGSNEAGIHGAGAAKFAITKGAKYGKSYGHYGNSFAIPTKDQILETLPLHRIRSYIHGFLAYAIGHPKLDFQITAIGCGLAGFAHEKIAPIFMLAPKNCYFDEDWRPYLSNDHNYWGTF